MFTKTSKTITVFTGMLFDDTTRMIFLFESNNNLAEIFSKCTSLVVSLERISSNIKLQSKYRQCLIIVVLNI